MNKTGLQPTSRPVEQILGFFPTGLKNYQNSNHYMGVLKWRKKRCKNIFAKCLLVVCGYLAISTTKILIQ